jgi:SEC-C motif-containing protein
MARHDECPCHSGVRYGECCRPLHEGKRPAASPVELMRSRYAAFARGLGAYLVETLGADHPDRASHDPVALARALSRAKERRRFLGLTILDSSVDGDRGEVEFHARVFERGVDRSFTERSVFVREGGLWRYAGTG